MCPDKQFLLVHDQLVRADERLADCVLDRADYSFHSSDTGMMFGQSDPELNEGEYRLRLEMTFISVSTRSLPALTLFRPASIQMMRAKVLLNPLVILWEL